MTDKQPIIRAFNDDGIKQLIKDAAPELRLYIRAMKSAMEGQRTTTALAVKKVAEQESEKAVLVEALQLADHLEALYKEKDSLEAMIYNDGKYTQEQFDRAIWLGQEIIRTFAAIHSALAQVRGK